MLRYLKRRLLEVAIATIAFLTVSQWSSVGPVLRDFFTTPEGRSLVESLVKDDWKRDSCWKRDPFNEENSSVSCLLRGEIQVENSGVLFADVRSLREGQVYYGSLTLTDRFLIRDAAKTRLDREDRAALAHDLTVKGVEKADKEKAESMAVQNLRAEVYEVRCLLKSKASKDGEQGIVEQLRVLQHEVNRLEQRLKAVGAIRSLPMSPSTARPIRNPVVDTPPLMPSASR